MLLFKRILETFQIPYCAGRFGRFTCSMVVVEMQKLSSDLLHFKQVYIVTPYPEGLERFLEISSIVDLNIWSQSSPAFISLHRVGLVSNWARWGLIGISIPAAFTASGNLAGLAVAMQTVGVLSWERCLRIKQSVICYLATTRGVGI